MTIGIIGPGKVGTAIARCAVEAGVATYVCGSPGREQELELILSIAAPGARACSLETLVEAAEIVVLSLPFRKSAMLPNSLLAGKIIIDLMNYWPPTDGLIEEIANDPRGTSEIVADHIPEARIVKTLNHLGYHELEDDALPAGSPGRRALGVASNDHLATATVCELVDRLGFDPVDVGALRNGAGLQPGTPVFGRRLNRDEFVNTLRGATSIS